MDMEQFNKLEKAIWDLQGDVNELKETIKILEEHVEKSLTELVSEIHDSLKLTEAEMRDINYKLKELKT
jgi:chromosome segregation ATPase